MKEKKIFKKYRNFILFAGLMFFFVYVFLPFLNRSFKILDDMSFYLEEYNIDPSRYYYTDVDLVYESELYLREVLD